MCYLQLVCWADLVDQVTWMKKERWRNCELPELFNVVENLAFSQGNWSDFSRNLENMVREEGKLKEKRRKKETDMNRQQHILYPPPVFCLPWGEGFCCIPHYISLTVSSGNSTDKGWERMSVDSSRWTKREDMLFVSVWNRVGLISIFPGLVWFNAVVLYIV